MKISRGKAKTTAIAFVLVLTMAAAFITCLPAVTAQNEHYVDSYMYIVARPNPVGVNQTVLILYWHDKEPPGTPEDASYGTEGGRAAWVGTTVTVTKPDGTIEILGPFNTYSIGDYYTSYVPDTVGTYYLQANFPGQWKNNTIEQLPFYLPATYFRPASSEKIALTVQQEPIQPFQEPPLPTGYWGRPIEGENREWYAIGGNWLAVPNRWGSGYNETGLFNPYTTAPNTAHVVWTKPIAFAGVVGGEFGTKTYFPGVQYESKWLQFYGYQAVIIGGRLYYNQRLGSSDWQGTACVDLRTGEEIWFKNGTNISMGQLLDFETPDQHGVIAYLWNLSSTFKMYDAWTGDWILDMKNGPTFTTYGGDIANKGTSLFGNILDGMVILGEHGEILHYTLSGANNWLAMWNSSKVSGMQPGQNGTNAWRWRPPTGATLDYLTGVQWNVTIPRPGLGGQAIVSLSDKVILASERTDIDIILAIGYDAETGQQLWTRNFTSSCAFRPGFFFTQIVDGKFAFWKQETREWFCFDAYTGNQIWGPTEPYGNAWSMYSGGWGGSGAYCWTIAYDKLYYGSVDGHLYCRDWNTGKPLWNYSSDNSGLETTYGTWPLNTPPVVADKKVYIASGDHTANSPLYRGARLRCVNATTGDGIWTILGWYETPIVADGYLVTYNDYDGQIYCFGKGKTATTVTVPDNVQTFGTPILIKGTVTDQSPGDTCLGIPAAGTPAISDASMGPWMEYLYMQKPMPTNASGVSVFLQAMKSDGTVIDITHVTSDIMGHYEYMWTPPAEGAYKVLATFDGSESYWGSSAQTALGVSEASPASGSAETLPPYEMITIGAAIAIIIAIAIVGLMILRKKP
jgi:outer membrane protein assembly factor BamB